MTYDINELEEQPLVDNPEVKTIKKTVKGVKQKIGQLVFEKQIIESKLKIRKDIRLDKKLIKFQKEIDALNKELANFITKLKEIPEKIPIMDIMTSLLEQLEDQLLKLKNSNETKILSEWKKWDNILGLNVRILSNDIEYIGIARDISTNGQLLLELKDGRTMKFSTGDLIL